MRGKLIKALAHSRILVRDQVELQACIHNGHYVAGNSECKFCEFEFECQWLYKNDEFAALQHKTTDNLLEALQFAEAYIDAMITRWGHNKRTCCCETCTWLRNVRRLLRDVQD